jgi:hypothetical protein
MPCGGFFHTIVPKRLYDSRPWGTNNPNPPQGAGQGQIIPGENRTIYVTGYFGIPYNATAALVNITVANAYYGGNIKAFPANLSNTPTSAVNWYNSYLGLGSRVVASFAVVGLDYAGNFKVRAEGSSTDVIVDVYGYISPEADSGGLFTALAGSNSVLYNSNDGDGPFGLGMPPRTISVTGQLGIPNSATAVVVNLIADNTVSGGYFTLYPRGSTNPTVSTVNWTNASNPSTTNVATTVSNSAIVPIGLYGQIDILAGGISGSSANVRIEVQGYINSGYAYQLSNSTGFFFPLSQPFRLYDSRPCDGSAIFCGEGTLPYAVTTRTVPVAGIGGVPYDATAVAVRVTTVQVDGAGFLALYPGTTWLNNKTVNTTNAAQIMGNVALVPLDANGTITVRNGSGPQKGFILDIIGFMLCRACY